MYFLNLYIDFIFLQRLVVLREEVTQKSTQFQNLLKDKNGIRNVKGILTHTMSKVLSENIESYTTCPSFFLNKDPIL